MKNTIRCCISCILPCGALDVVRIVHVNGRVEEISSTIRANEVMKAHPKHILKKPTSRPNSDAEGPASGPTIVVVPPDAQLQRGKIYFLIPVHDQTTSSSTKKKTAVVAAKKASSTPSISSGGSAARRRRREQKKNSISIAAANNDHNNLILANKEGDKYLSEILSEKVISNHKEKRRGRVNVWRPHLESITETLSEAASSDQ
ncbi:Na(+)/H(+) antiporter [Bienertia sinuspersici]